jgi:hypothetical protein
MSMDERLAQDLGAILEKVQRESDFNIARGVFPSEIDCSWESLPRCPWCSHVMTEPPEFSRSFGADGDETEEMCSRCDREFSVELHVSFDYSTTRKEVDE